MEYGAIDLAGITTHSAATRENLVRIENLRTPGSQAETPFDDPDFEHLVQRMAAARANGRPIIWFIGAHVIKCGLSRYLIALMQSGWITHLAGNGAVSIHDFELAYLGGTSENVPTAIEDGSFGMWEETGRWMNEAIAEGAREGRGYAEALARAMAARPDRFPHREDSVLYRAYAMGVPMTCHITIGTDITHQHPAVDFAATGAASGLDFRRFCHSVAHMDGGVFLNFGSAVTGAEVFLKALSIARNLAYPTFRITTANFDLKPLPDYRSPVGYDNPDYYYRPRKNIVNRPVSRGGMGWHFCVDHQVSIPALYQRLAQEGQAPHAP